MLMYKPVENVDADCGHKYLRLVKRYDPSSMGKVFFRCNL